MPFRNPNLTKNYETYIKKPLEDKEYEVKRVNDFLQPVPIVDDILKSISKADIIIAELTESNPNVYYELGRSHEKNKYVIQICQQNPEELPFDIRGIRTIQYEDSPKGYKSLQQKILKSINKYITSR